MKRVPEDCQARVAQLHREGKAVSEIMQQLSLSRSFVYRILGDVGQVRHSSLQKDMTPEILRCYFEGKSVYEVARELNISKSTVHRVVAAADAVRPIKGSNNPAVAKARRKSIVVDGLKLCTGCKEWFTLDRFPTSTMSLDGRRPQCLKCHELVSHRWRQTEAGKLYHKIKMRMYSHRVRQATPAWLSKEDKQKINALYMEAVTKQLAEGRVYHVDHAMPLNGRDVCGLHVPWNLQILVAVDNCRKGNKH